MYFEFEIELRKMRGADLVAEGTTETGETGIRSGNRRIVIEEPIRSEQSTPILADPRETEKPERVSRVRNGGWHRIFVN